MQVSVHTAPRQQSGQAPSMLADAYRKGYTIPCLPYQEFGIIAKELWVRQRYVPQYITGALAA